jgi:tetratricopeptide (TPR) repeat protein
MTAAERADEAWREGRILEAQREYQTIANNDPNAWGALLQLAWLDAAFGKLTAARARALERPGLSESARDIVRTLEQIAGDSPSLEGTVADWDIENLRRRGGGETYSSWWEAKGRAAQKAGLYGVALACLEEAESREPSGAYWDPPGWTHSLPAHLEGHLKVVAEPFQS